MVFALLLTFIAGFATVIGGFLATNKRMLKRSYLAVALAFSAGAMIFVSLTDILGKSIDAFTGNYTLMALAFFAGVALVGVLDRLIPQDINPNDTEGKKTLSRLKRSGLLIAIALTLHNFPEGFLVFMSVLNDPTTGIAIAVALAIHNIPEGIAVAAPMYASGKSRAKTIALTAITGVAEPIGALLGFYLLQPYLDGPVLGWVFGVVAGMMVFISIDELLPASKRYEIMGKHHTTYGFIAGMGVVALSISLLS